MRPKDTPNHEHSGKRQREARKSYKAPHPLSPRANRDATDPFKDIPPKVYKPPATYVPPKSPPAKMPNVGRGKGPGGGPRPGKTY